MRRLLILLLVAGCATAPTQHHRLGSTITYLPTTGGGLTPIAADTALCNATGSTALPTACAASDLQTAGLTQNPASVSITGGTIALGAGTYEGVAAAIVPGIDLGFDWEYQAANFLKSKNASLTACKIINVGSNGNGQAASASAGAFGDAQHEGGSVSSPANTIKQWTAVVTAVPKSGNWAIEYRGSNAVPAAGHSTFVQLANYGAAHDVFLGGVPGTSTTNWTLGIDAAAAHYVQIGIAMDGGVHNVAIVSNGTVLTPYIDGMAGTTLANSNFASDEGMFISTYTNVVADLGVDRMVFCYVAR